jgi:hypothetical protein
MKRRRVRNTGRLAVVALLGLVSPSMRAQDQSTLLTQVLGRMDSRRVAEGAPFFVKAISPWKLGHCTVGRGAILEGRITRVQRKGSGVKREEMGLRFLPVPCSGDESAELQPVLVAMGGMRPDPREAFIVQQELAHALAGSIRLAPGQATGAAGGGAGARTPGSPGTVSGAAGNLGNYAPAASSAPLRVAEVRGLPGIKLALPGLISDPTTLSCSEQILIDPGTHFLLIMEMSGRESASASAETSGVAAPEDASGSMLAPAPDQTARAAQPVAPAPQPVEVERCVETGCADADSAMAQSDEHEERRIPLRPHGFRARNNRVLRGLSDDAAVAFLGEDQVLVTFNTHPLIARTQKEVNRVHAPRIIRALAFSARTGKLIRAEDWRVPDEGAYLWPVDGGRVLAHVGDHLIRYGPGLAVLERWETGGDLQSVQVAPSREFIVATVTRERHTPEEHQKLVDFLGPAKPVDEDVDFTVLDERLHVKTSRRLETAFTEPVLLDTGLIASAHGLRQRWSVMELTWDNDQRQIVRVDSPCALRMQTLPGNLILLVGCSGDETSSWYKVVRPDGKTLLRGTIARDGWLEQADAPAMGKVFAIGIARASHPVDFTQGMVASDFLNLGVSVYRSPDGHRIYSARSAKGAVDRQSFALSNGGDRLAILSGEEVTLYRIGSSHPAPAAGSSH